MFNGFSSILRGLLLIIITCSVAQMLSAQDALMYARKAANDLADGTLVVRVFTNSGKIKQLRNLLSSAEISQKSRAVLEKQLANAEKENDVYWNDLKSTFDKYYTFSKVYFMPDSLYKDFEAGNDEVFWDKDRRIDKSLQIDRTQYFIMITGDNHDQLLLVTKDLVTLDKPFPVRINTFLPSFRRIFNRKSYFEKQVTGFQSKLMQLKS